MPDTSRVESVDPHRLTPAQQRVYERIAGTRGRVAGPFTVLLQNAELADRVQRVGAYLRYETELQRDIAETAVLVTARVWDSSFEWEAHEPHARAAGVPDAVLDALRDDRPVSALPDRFRIVTAYVRALARTRRVPADLYREAHGLLGTTGIVDLTVLVGYYTMLAMTLGAHEID